VRRELALGISLALAAVTAAHPTAHHHAPVLDALAPVLARWTAVHLLQLILFPLLALSVAGLVRGARSRTAVVARIALAAFAVLYTAFDTVAGLGTAALVSHARAQPAEAQALLRGAVQAYFEDPLTGAGGVIAGAGSLAWLAGAGATAVVLWRERGARLASAALALAAVALAVSHVPPLGPAAMLLVAATVLLCRATPAPAPGPA
jgi:hypothetical protein